MDSMTGNTALLDVAPSLPPDAPRESRVPYRISLEGLLWAALLVLAALSRFIDLGARAMHHDESLHAKYSWDFFQGHVYQQDPLMHGPFMFHLIAGSFWLFGDSDASARYPAALFGVIMVGLPWFLRRELGRGGALLLSLLLLISPGYLYFSRFIREDIFAAVAMFIFFMALVKFIARPSKRSPLVLGGAIGFFTTTKEIYFLEFGLFALFLGAWLAWQLAPRLLLIFGAYIAIAAIVLNVMMKIAPYPQLDTVQDETQAWNLFTKQVLPHPLTLTILTLIVLGLVVAWFALREVAVTRKAYLEQAAQALGGPKPQISAAQALFLPYEEGSVAYAFGWLGRHWSAVGYSALFGFGIYSLFYTTFFANIPGEAGLLRSLGYWIAQQGVERGSQPWYYYFLLVPLYEPLAMTFGVIGIIFFGLKFVRHSRRARSEETRHIERAAWPSAARRVQHPYFFEMALIVWAVGNFAIFTWASEKMPWLMLHVALPFMVLSALVLARAIQAASHFLSVNGRGQYWIVTGWLRTRTAFGGLCVLLVIIFLATYRLLTTLSYGQPANLVTTFGPLNLNGNDAWVMALSGFAILILLALALGTIFVGWRLAITAATLTLAGLLGIFLIHTGTNYAYDHGDVPIEMGIYVQTSPDVVRLSQELQNLSTMLPEGKGVKILYDSEVSWPLEWYLRNYPNRQKVTNIPQPGDPNIKVTDYPIIAIIDWKVNGTAQDNNRQMDAYQKDYYQRHYVLRWWYPEEPYRDLVPVSIAQREFLRGKPSVAALPYTHADGSVETLVAAGQTMTDALLDKVESDKLLDQLYRSNNGPALNRPTVSTQQVMRNYLRDKPSQGTIRDASGAVVVNAGDQMTDAVLDKAENAKRLEQLYAMNGGHVLTDMLGWSAASVGNFASSTEMQARLFRYFMLRDPFQPIQSYDFTVYVRKDIAPMYRAYGDLIDQSIDLR